MSQNDAHRTGCGCSECGPTRADPLTGDTPEVLRLEERIRHLEAQVELKHRIRHLEDLLVAYRNAEYDPTPLANTKQRAARAALVNEARFIEQCRPREVPQ